MGVVVGVVDVVWLDGRVSSGDRKGTCCDVSGAVCGVCAFFVIVFCFVWAA